MLRRQQPARHLLKPRVVVCGGVVSGAQAAASNPGDQEGRAPCLGMWGDGVLGWPACIWGAPSPVLFPSGPPHAAPSAHGSRPPRGKDTVLEPVPILTEVAVKRW